MDVDKKYPTIDFSYGKNQSCEVALELSQARGAVWVGDVVCSGLSSWPARSRQEKVMKAKWLACLAMFGGAVRDAGQRGGDQNHLVGCGGAQFVLWKTTPTITFSSPPAARWIRV
jgi:hypothetical protein